MKQKELNNDMLRLIIFGTKLNVTELVKCLNKLQPGENKPYVIQSGGHPNFILQFTMNTHYLLKCQLQSGSCKM